VPVIFRTPVIIAALAVRGIIMNVTRLMVASLFVKGLLLAEFQSSAILNSEISVEPAENGMRIA
jgi:hypothetical protein